MIIVFLIVGWCGVIFYASSRTSDESNTASKKLLYDGLNIALTITNKLKFTNIELTQSNYRAIVDKLNYPLRKCAHATVYFILAILMTIFLKLFGIKKGLALLVTISFCFIFSLTDEYHQTFVSNRTGQFSDCLIDTTGAIAGAGLLFMFSKKDAVNSKFLS